ncbi:MULTISPECIES: hypothetical protein [unclassified Methylibium]|jgi:hypothetical protein|uniref:hypothetical protein n=1 Tax=unclassified Methylibium TaxID=2633235 RepID=UPI00071486F6|nr:hypothetical protein [Methylibium sp. Root1272]KQW66266.1 hypothetical protein ASC67_14235 [Methylibium sp. Root1272]
MPTRETELALAEALEQAYRLALELLDVLDEARAAMVRGRDLPASTCAADRPQGPARRAERG